LGAVNSINWARILAQTVYYFLSYFHVQKYLPPGTSVDEAEIQYVVPTGNFGDILAGYYAKRMGLPMGKLVVASNANDILTRFWKSGRYEKFDSGELAAKDSGQAIDASGVIETLSPAMDIVISSNFERLLWYLAFGNTMGGSEGERRGSASQTLDGWMRKMKIDGKVQVPMSVLQAANRDFTAERISDEVVRDSCIHLPASGLIFYSVVIDIGDYPQIFQLKTVLCRRSPHRCWPGCGWPCFHSQVSALFPIRSVFNIRLRFLFLHQVLSIPIRLSSPRRILRNSQKQYRLHLRQHRILTLIGTCFQ